jgi:hypothetical protein
VITMLTAIQNTSAKRPPPAFLPLEVWPATSGLRRIPHPIPYQGSKRNLAPAILEPDAGWSFQATLLGRDEVPVESLYFSPVPAESLHLRRSNPRRAAEQLVLMGGGKMSDLKFKTSDSIAGLLFEKHDWRRSVYHYILTLAPGFIRYLYLEDLLTADVDACINYINTLSPQPALVPPPYVDFERDTSAVAYGEVPKPLRLKNCSGPIVGWNPALADKYFPGANWEDRLRLHHKLGTTYLETGLPTEGYLLFHKCLGLQDVRVDRCLEAWDKRAWADYNVASSYEQSSQHLLIAGNYGKRYVFQKTPFVLGRLAVLEAQAKQEAEQRALEAEQEATRRLEDEATRRGAEDLERLRRSSYQTFVYLMEDLRNGHFKIGRSKTPGKRERTLQAEVPQIVLRLSIPADEGHEKELHNLFADKRLRGEWFTLSPDELLSVVSFLKQNGDLARAAVDHQWLGKVFFTATNTDTTK